MEMGWGTSDVQFSSTGVTLSTLTASGFMTDPAHEASTSVVPAPIIGAPPPKRSPPTEVPGLPFPGAAPEPGVAPVPEAAPEPPLAMFSAPEPALGEHAAADANPARKRQGTNSL